MPPTSLKQWQNSVPVADQKQALSYDNLRDQFVGSAPDVSMMVLLSGDGLTLAAYGLDADSADHIAAACSGLQSLGTALSVSVSGGGVQYHNITLVTGHLVIVGCGDRSVLITLIRGDGRISSSIRETVRIARGFAPQMASDPRASDETAQ
ncbi:roadblock/LC7 domain-containing protein [Streptomyces sp. NPDC051572]|uniref:roadblock/LC7 domain-containing protein n=1 Tax=Streptomyces sp. NPDC051572 TaxID=3155802 RepID=UPI0034506D70